MSIFRRYLRYGDYATHTRSIASRTYDQFHLFVYIYLMLKHKKIFFGHIKSEKYGVHNFCIMLYVGKKKKKDIWLSLTGKELNLSLGKIYYFDIDSFVN